MEKEKVLEIEIKKVFLGYAWLIKRNKLKVIRDLGTQSRPGRSEFYDKELFVELKQHDNYYEEIKYGTPERNYFFENNRLMSEEEKEKLIEIVNKINEKYGIPKRWRAEKNKTYYLINYYGHVCDVIEENIERDGELKLVIVIILFLKETSYFVSKKKKEC